MSIDGERRSEILDTAAELFGTYGVRTSLQQVADACGILPGSLYHHFESKDAIYVELVERYRVELDGIAEQATGDPPRLSRSPLERVVALATAIADCAVRHRAALLLSRFEPPAGSSDELVRLATGTTARVRDAMAETLGAARSSGDLRAGMDLSLLADRFCQSMLDVGMGEHYRARGAGKVSELKCQVMLHGVAVRPISERDLVDSAALRAADEAIATWSDDEDDGTAARIRDAARQEFARRGYEATTVRDIAAAAGLSAGGVYRHIESKDALYWSIMQSYMDRITDAWARVARSSSTPLEKLDAWLWLTVNVTNRFASEHKVQELGQRYSPSTSQHLVWSAPQIRALKRVLQEGARRGELRMGAPSVEMWARCVFALTWERETIVRKAGLRGAWELSRDTVLRGVAARR